VCVCVGVVNYKSAECVVVCVCVCVCLCAKYRGTHKSQSDYTCVCARRVTRFANAVCTKVGVNALVCVLDLIAIISVRLHLCACSESNKIYKRGMYKNR